MIPRYYNATVLKFYRNATSLALGVDKPGYLHMSKMKPKEEFVVNASDILNLKDVIPVRVLKIKQKEVEARVQAVVWKAADAHTHTHTHWRLYTGTYTYRHALALISKPHTQMISNICICKPIRPHPHLHSASCACQTLLRHVTSWYNTYRTFLTLKPKPVLRLPGSDA